MCVYFFPNMQTYEHLTSRLNAAGALRSSGPIIRIILLHICLSQQGRHLVQFELASSLSTSRARRPLFLDLDRHTELVSALEIFKAAFVR